MKMNRMKHLISSVFLVVWMAGIFSAFGAGCGGNHACCTTQKEVSFTSLAYTCGVASCPMIQAQDLKKDAPLLSKSFQIELAQILITTQPAFQGVQFSSNFNLSLSNIDPPGVATPLYVRHQQFLI